MENLWQSSNTFHNGVGEEYKFVGEHGTSYIDEIYVLLEGENKYTNELVFIIKERVVDLYKFHSNPSELLGYDNSNTRHTISEISNDTNYIHDADDIEITSMIEESLFMPLSTSFSKQFGYSFDMLPMDWDVEYSSHDGRLTVVGTF